MDRGKEGAVYTSLNKHKNATYVNIKGENFSLGPKSAPNFENIFPVNTIGIEMSPGPEKTAPTVAFEDADDKDSAQTPRDPLRSVSRHGAPLASFFSSTDRKPSPDFVVVVRLGFQRNKLKSWVARGFEQWQNLDTARLFCESSLSVMTTLKPALCLFLFPLFFRRGLNLTITPFGRPLPLVGRYFDPGTGTMRVIGPTGHEQDHLIYVLAIQQPQAAWTVRLAPSTFSS